MPRALVQFAPTAARCLAPCRGAGCPELRAGPVKLCLLGKPAKKKTSLTAFGLLTLRQSAVTVLIESIVLFLFPSKTSPVDAPEPPLPARHTHFNAIAPAAAACQGSDAAREPAAPRHRTLSPPRHGPSPLVAGAGSPSSSHQTPCRGVRTCLHPGEGLWPPARGRAATLLRAKADAAGSSALR